MAYTQEQIEKIESEAVESKKWVGNIDEMVNLLNYYKSLNLNYYYNFNGHKCYALLDNEDSCYQKITGKTKAEYDEAQRKWHEEYERREAEEKKKADESIPGWIEEGKGMIYPQRHGEWEKCVKIRAGDLYHGLDLVGALEVMKHLDNGGSLEDAKKIIDNQNHSGASYGMVMSMLVTFSKRGPELYRYMENNLSPETEKFLKKIEAENAQYESENTPAGPGSGE